jgi:hypothetical protein
MRRRLAVLSALALLTAGTTVLPAAAAYDECLFQGPTISADEGDYEPLVLNSTLQVPIEMWAAQPDIGGCDGITATVQKTDGSLKTVVALTQTGGRGSPPSYTRYGFFTVNAATGGGDWVITSVAHAGNVITPNKKFHVYRGSVVTFDQPARTSSTARTTLSGRVQRYSNTGSLVAASGVTVKLLHQTQDLLLATVKTDSTGHFKTSLAFTQGTTLRAFTPTSGNYYQTYSEFKTAHKLLAMSYLTAAKTAKVGSLWKVTGTAFPGHLYTQLQWNYQGNWINAGSAGYVAANGSYARYLKPPRAEVYQLRVVVTGVRIDNSPWNREVTLTAS